MGESGEGRGPPLFVALMGERPRTHEDKSGFVQYAAVLRNTRHLKMLLWSVKRLGQRCVLLDSLGLVYSRFGPLLLLECLV